MPFATKFETRLQSPAFWSKNKAFGLLGCADAGEVVNFLGNVCILEVGEDLRIQHAHTTIDNRAGALGPSLFYWRYPARGSNLAAAGVAKSNGGFGFTAIRSQVMSETAVLQNHFPS